MKKRKLIGCQIQIDSDSTKKRSQIADTQMSNNSAQEKPMTNVEHGLMLSLDYALSLLSESDEYRLIKRLVRQSGTQGFWGLIETMVLGDAATTTTKALGVGIVEKLYYDDNKDRIRDLVLKLLDFDSFDDVDLVIKFVNEVEDPIFLDRLLILETKSNLPCWLQDTLKDAITNLKFIRAQGIR